MKPVFSTVTAAQPLKVNSLDNCFCAVLGVQVVPSGGAEYTVDYSFDDPNSQFYPVAFANMAWDDTMTSVMAIGSSEAITYTMPVSPLWIRLRLLNGVGSVRATYLQVGMHARSDVLNPGPLFADPDAPLSNFNAMK